MKKDLRERFFTFIPNNLHPTQLQIDGEPDPQKALDSARQICKSAEASSHYLYVYQVKEDVEPFQEPSDEPDTWRFNVIKHIDEGIKKEVENMDAETEQRLYEMATEILRLQRETNRLIEKMNKQLKKINYGKP